MLQSIKIYDRSFYPDKSTSKYHPDIKNFRWCRDEMIPYTDNKIIVYTDLCLSEVDNAPPDAYKVALLIEPFVIYPHSYQYIQQNYEKFDLVLTHHEYMLDLDPRIKWVPGSMCWVEQKDFGVYRQDKQNRISIIASEKNYAPGHQVRHQLVSQYMYQSNEVARIFDIYGRGYKPVQDKIDALKPYMYSVAIENCQQDLYFTEKLIDCFVTGTIPVYYGPVNIGKIFDYRGILMCNTLRDLNETLKMIANEGAEFYNDASVQRAIEFNYDKAMEYIILEDYMYNYYLKNIIYASNI